jgi:hypothetical protein
MRTAPSCPGCVAQARRELHTRGAAVPLIVGSSKFLGYCLQRSVRTLHSQRCASSSACGVTASPLSRTRSSRHRPEGGARSCKIMDIIPEIDDPDVSCLCERCGCLPDHGKCADTVENVRFYAGELGCQPLSMAMFLPACSCSVRCASPHTSRRATLRIAVVVLERSESARFELLWAHMRGAAACSKCRRQRGARAARGASG